MASEAAKAAALEELEGLLDDLRETDDVLVFLKTQTPPAESSERDGTGSRVRELSVEPRIKPGVIIFCKPESEPSPPQEECSWDTSILRREPKCSYIHRWAPYSTKRKTQSQRLRLMKEKLKHEFLWKMDQFYLELKAKGIIGNTPSHAPPEDQACEHPPGSPQPGAPGTSEPSEAKTLDAFKRLSVSASTSADLEEGDLEDWDRPGLGDH